MIIVGRTGSGKTILCNLVTRILEPPHGYLFFDGVEVHEIPLEVLRRSIGYVPQDTFLFSDTIRENIAFGKPDATEEKIEEAARIAQIYDEIIEFPGGLDTVIGEKGVTLPDLHQIATARDTDRERKAKGGLVGLHYWIESGSNRPETSGDSMRRAAFSRQEIVSIGRMIESCRSGAPKLGISDRSFP